MTIYHRPNLTAAQKDRLAEIVLNILQTLTVDSPEFADLYRCYLKLVESKPVSTEPKPKS